MSLAPFGRRRLRVTGRRAVGAYDVLSVADPDGPAPDAGQFAMLAAADGWGGLEDERPFLPRAFSVARRHPTARSTSCSRTSGPGPSGCARWRPARTSGWSGRWAAGSRPPGEGRRPVLVGGGVGIAPLMIWSDVLGGRPPCSASATPHTPRAPRCSRRARVATDDGSVGHHGLVTELLGAELAGAEVYACGPPPMLEAVRALCAEHDVPAQLALESGMACGFGACFGCVVPTREGYVRLCVDGPVLDAAALEEVA